MDEIRKDAGGRTLSRIRTLHRFYLDYPVGRLLRDEYLAKQARSMLYRIKNCSNPIPHLLSDPQPHRPLMRPRTRLFPS